MTRLPIGLSLSRPSPSALIEAVVEADSAGIPTVWSTIAGTAPDALTTFAAAATRTERVALGTSIVPAYPRHPIVLASQAMVLADLAPGRFRLGVGSSHRPVVEGVFGLTMDRPLTYMREYLTVLRGLLWEGRSQFQGEFFRVNASLPEGVAPPRTPLLLSALRPNAFRQAGEIADGAISWVCPISYLVDSARPALHEGASSAERSAPPLIAHVPVVVTEDRDRARSIGGAFLTRYARLPFYAAMFAEAGYDVGGGAAPQSLVDDLVVWGDGARVVAALGTILSRGIDEILVSVLPSDSMEDEERRLMEALGAA